MSLRAVASFLVSLIFLIAWKVFVWRKFRSFLYFWSSLMGRLDVESLKFGMKPSISRSLIVNAVVIRSDLSDLANSLRVWSISSKTCGRAPDSKMSLSVSFATSRALVILVRFSRIGW